MVAVRRVMRWWMAWPSTLTVARPIWDISMVGVRHTLMPFCERKRRLNKSERAVRA